MSEVVKVIEKMASEGHDDSWGDGTGKPKNAFEIKSVSSPRSLLNKAPF